MQINQACLKINEDTFDQPAPEASAQLFAIYRSINTQKESSHYFVKILCNGFSYEGLSKGDIVKIDTEAKAKKDDTILIRRNDELVLKKWVRLRDDFYLYPESPGFQSVKMSSKLDFEILGVVTSVMKDCS